MSSAVERSLRVLVVDDSAYNRKTITFMLESLPGVEVVGRALDGKQALQLACDLKPDLITLDLEMPEMDGFAFLRLLMARQPTPVLVISGYSARENVFRALELGALDFIATPGHSITPDLRKIANELSEKIEIVRRLQTVGLKTRKPDPTRSLRLRGRMVPTQEPLSGEKPAAIIGIAASTGGPPAIQELLLSLPADLSAAIVIAQHMPSQFTNTFASRLDGIVNFRVVEAKNGQGIYAGVVYVAPGASNLAAKAGGSKGIGTIRLVEPSRSDSVGVTITPSADYLFCSLAEQFGSRVCGVIVTGMGSDGTIGAKAVHMAGGKIFAEDPQTAVMPGMPRSVVESGIVDGVFRLETLHRAIEEFVDDQQSLAREFA